MANQRGRAYGHRVYCLLDPRQRNVAYVSAGTGDAPWLTPQCHPQSEAAAWLVELAAAGLAPRVDFDGLPVSYLPAKAARWIVQNRTAELIAAGMTVVTGVAPARVIQPRQPRG
jgi:hypothetical protein